MKLTKLEVQQFIQGRTDNEVSDITAVSGGEWSQAFFYQDGDIQKIIRFSNIDEDFKRDQFAYSFNSPQLPIPQVEEIGRAFDGYFVISERVEGEMIDNLDPVEMQKIVSKLMDLFGAMRLADISKSKGFGGLDRNSNGTDNSWKHFLLTCADDLPNGRTHGWKKKLADRKIENDIFNQSYQLLSSLVDICPENRHLIHSDLLHFNLLVKESRIVAVIDWGCAKYGDFLYDLAWFVFWQFYYPSMNGIDFTKEAKKYFESVGVALPNFEKRLKCYQLNIGLDSMAYCSFKENWKNVKMVSDRL